MVSAVHLPYKLVTQAPDEVSDADEIFLTIYRELYFRHVYARLSPDLDDRFHSYENYCSLFNLILNSPGPVPLSLPIDWLYNMLVLSFLFTLNIS